MPSKTENLKVARPNILLICTDQQRFSALGAAGNTEIHTPHLDRLAAGGAMFENCYVQSPVCGPSRASLMTGMYVHNHGLWANGVALPAHHQLVSETVAAAGYDCGLVGKLHLEACFAGRTEQAPPGMRVFRWAHDPYPGSSENAYRQFLRHAHPELHGAMLAGETDFTWDTIPTEAHYSRWIGNETIDYLTRGRERDKPFFFIANFFDPHHGFGAPQEYVNRYLDADLADPVTTARELESKPDIYTEASKESYGGHARGYVDYSPAELRQVRAAYYAMVTLVDDEVGRILETLDAEGLTDNTVVIFTSDHGEMLGDHQLMLKGPMMYDCAVRVPLLISWPGHIDAGQRVSELVQWIDLTATVVEASDAEPMAAGQGKSLLPLITGTDRADVDHRGWAICEYRNSGHPYDPPVHTTMLRRADTKIVVHHGWPSTTRNRQGELYDLAHDPHELENLWDEPDSLSVRNEMTNLLLDVLVATEDRSQSRDAFW